MALPSVGRWRLCAGYGIYCHPLDEFEGLDRAVCAGFILYRVPRMQRSGPCCCATGAMIAAFIFRRNCEVCTQGFTSRSGRARWCETCRPKAYRESQRQGAAKKLKRAKRLKRRGNGSE